MNIAAFRRSVAAALALAPFALGIVACQPAGEAGEPAAVPIPVRSEVAQAAPLRSSRFLLGRVEPADRVSLVAPRPGRISYPPRFAAGLRTGERVRRGEPLARIANLEQDNAWRSAEVHIRAARAEAERAERTFKAGVSAAAEVERARFELESAEAELENLRRSRGELEIVAPRDGVLRLEGGALAPGSRVEAGAALAELAGDGPLEVELWAAAADLEQLAVGARVRCRLSGNGEVRGEGKLVELDRLLDAGGLARGRARIDQDLGMPRPGSGVEAEVDGAEVNGLTVPEAAIVWRGGVATLFVLESRGAGYLAKARAATLGAGGGGRVLVQSGLQPGDRVAIEGADLLVDGAVAVEATPTDEGSRR